MKTCIDAYKNLYIEQKQDGIYVAPCCIADPLEKIDNLDFKNNNRLNQTRKLWDKNEFDFGCRTCENAEKNGLKSRRQGSNQWYQDNDLYEPNIELVRIDYWTGDLCNCACVICGPEFSSKWKQELKIINIKHRVNKFWKKLDLSQIKFVHFNGGEPLLSKEHILFLESFHNKKEVELNYNTNGTVLPSEHLKNLWSKFKLVQLDFSIDDIGTRYEYQRYPANWTQLITNLKYFNQSMPVNCMFNVNTAISVLNHFTISELDLWLQENFFQNRLGDPIEHRKQFVYGLLDLKTYKENSSKIVDWLDTLDRRRKTNWRLSLPELSEILL